MNTISKEKESSVKIITVLFSKCKSNIIWRDMFSVALCTELDHVSVSEK